MWSSSASATCALTRITGLSARRVLEDHRHLAPPQLAQPGSPEGRRSRPRRARSSRRSPPSGAAGASRSGPAPTRLNKDSPTTPRVSLLAPGENDTPPPRPAAPWGWRNSGAGTSSATRRALRRSQQEARLTSVKPPTGMVTEDREGQHREDEAGRGHEHQRAGVVSKKVRESLIIPLSSASAAGCRGEEAPSIPRRSRPRP